MTDKYLNEVVRNMTNDLEEIKEEICDHYCRFPGIVCDEVPADEDGFARQNALEAYCNECPLYQWR